MPTIISWNTRGECMSRLTANYGKLFSPDHYNIVMIQEAGNVTYTNGTLFDQQFGSTIRENQGHKFKASFYEQPDVGNKRCTTGMLVENGFGSSPNIFRLKTDDTDTDIKLGKRPIVCFDCKWSSVSEGTNHFIFATVHLTACEYKAVRELESLNKLFNKKFITDKDGNKYHWLIMGDFNCDASELEMSEDMNIAYPDGATHEAGKTLDFAMYSQSFKDEILKGELKLQVGGVQEDKSVPISSDHVPVYCTF